MSVFILDKSSYSSYSDNANGNNPMICSFAINEEDNQTNDCSDQMFLPTISTSAPDLPSIHILISPNSYHHLQLMMPLDTLVQVL